MFMIQIKFNPIEFGRFITRKNLRRTDIGYQCHLAIIESFGTDLVTVFRYMKNGIIIGYSNLNCDNLLINNVSTLIDEIKSIEIPDNITKFNFEVCFSPIVKSNGKERDAFLNAVDGGVSNITREDVYKDWFLKKTDGIIKIDSFDENLNLKMVKYSLVNVYRNNHKGGGKLSSKMIGFTIPIAVFRGSGFVDDRVSFNNLLKNGIGKHRDFGYGMLRFI